MLTFEKLTNLYCLTGTLELLHATHVGSGRSEGEYDSLFCRNEKGTFYIPGSSLRGSLRSRTEKILAGLHLEAVCLLGANPASPCPNGAQGPRFIQELEKSEKKWQEENAEPSLEQRRVDFIAQRTCRVCKVFGTPAMASRLRISDLFPIEERVPGIKRTQVAIDRDTETAASGKLFTYQVLEAGVTFSLELWAENMRPEDWGVLGVGLTELLEGNFRLGAKGAVGAGRCQLLADSLSLGYFDGPAELHNYLISKNFPQNLKAVKVRNFLNDRMEDLLKQFNPKKQD